MKLLSRAFFGLLAVTAIAMAALILIVGIDVGTPTAKQTADTSAYVSRSESTKGNSLSQTVTDSAPNPPDRELAASGYVMANAYSGQQGAGVRALASLQCLAGSYNLPVKIVEPFALGSQFKSDFSQDSTTPLKFGDLFDLQHFNKLSRQEAEPTLASWNDFVENAPRKVIFVEAQTPKKVKRIEFELLGDVKSGTGVKSLDTVTRNKQLCFSTKYTKNQQLNNLDFCVVRIAHLMLPDTKKMVTDDNLYKYLYGDWDPRHVTLVTSRWLRTTWVQNPSSLDIFNCSNLEWNRIQHRLLPSQKLLKAAQFYNEHYLQSSNEAVYTIMVRSEHVILSDANMSMEERINYFKSCLQTAIEKAHNGVNDTKVNRNIYLTLDISTYGSIAIPKMFEPELYNKSFEIMRNMVADIYNGHLSFEDWENSFLKASDGIDNPAYIAALQRTIASQSSCLILVGGGNFQYLAVEEYRRLHPNPKDQCIHTVCIRGRFTGVMNY